jgi:hypothetical protein
MEKMWHKNRNYQSDLAGQIDYYQRLRQQAYERDEQEYRLGVQAEYGYKTQYINT